jgi:hypothetical protein
MIDQEASRMTSEEPDTYLTADQTKVLDEVEATLGHAFDEARARLSMVGVSRESGGSGGFGCLRCSCEFFLSRNPEGLEPGSEFPPGACMRLGCAHRLTSHNII